MRCRTWRSEGAASCLAKPLKPNKPFSHVTTPCTFQEIGCGRDGGTLSWVTVYSPCCIYPPCCDCSKSGRHWGLRTFSRCVLSLREGDKISDRDEYEKKEANHLILLLGVPALLVECCAKVLSQENFGF
jgi:hypothetical protein